MVTEKAGKFEVKVWEAECLDCGFKTGLASISSSEGFGAMFTGSGCRERRDLAAVRKKVREWVEANS